LSKPLYDDCSHFRPGAGAWFASARAAAPTVMGTHRGDDKFVVITDGQPLMHLVLFWRDEIPRDWKPIAPGKDRRIACEVPVRYGDPNATESITEQSVLVRGYASVVVNNAKRLDEVSARVPTEARPFSELAAQFPVNAQPGLERIDWDPQTRTCKSVWANRRVVIPNGVPGMSSESGLVYGIGVRDGTWGLEGLDFATGEDRLWVPAGRSPNENSFFAGTEVGPDGSIWTGTFQGISSYAPTTALPPPGLECRDRAAPRVTLRRLRLGRRLEALAGRGSDLACGRRARVSRIQVSLRRASGRRCRFLGPSGRLGAATDCGRRTYLPARGRTRWSLRRSVRLAQGRYELRVRATDRAGNRSAAARSVRVR
jgi:hypothetical protein